MTVGINSLKKNSFFLDGTPIKKNDFFMAPLSTYKNSIFEYSVPMGVFWYVIWLYLKKYFKTLLHGIPKFEVGSFFHWMHQKGVNHGPSENNLSIILDCRNLDPDPKSCLTPRIRLFNLVWKLKGFIYNIKKNKNKNRSSPKQIYFL